MLQPRIYYGWWVLAALVIVGMMAYGVGLYAFTLFMQPLTQEFGWSRAATSASVSLFWVSAPLVIVLGAWTDRIGARALIVGGALIEGACLMLIGSIDSLWQLYVLRALMGIGKVMMVVPIPIAVAVWFSRYKGIALAITFAGWHLGGVLFAPATQLAIDELGWRSAAVVLGALLVVCSIVPALTLLRTRRPADLGLQPDGLGPIDTTAATTAPAGHSFREAASSGLFSVLIAATVIYYFAYAAVLTQQVAFLTDIGVDPQVAANALGMFAAIAITGVLTSGYLLDRLPAKPIVLGLLVCIAGSALLFLALTHGPNPAVMWTATVVFGFAAGGGDVIFATLVRICFGDRAYGSIFGLWYFFCLSMLTAGPIAAGYIYDTTRSYEVVFAAVVAGAALAFVLLSFAPIPRPTAAAPGSADPVRT